jgi:hypothetical protein
LTLSETACRALSHCELPVQFFVPTQRLIGKLLAAKAAGADALSRGKEPQAPGGRKALGAHAAVSHFTAAFSFHAARVQAAPRSAQSLAASVDQTPHSPQLKIRRSARPPVRGVVRVRCIDRPQFGQFGHGGRTMVWLPTGRFASWNANMIPRRDAFQTID